MSSPTASLDALGPFTLQSNSIATYGFLGVPCTPLIWAIPKPESPFPTPDPQNSTVQLNPGPPIRGGRFGCVLWNSRLQGLPPPPPWGHNRWDGCHLCILHLGNGEHGMKAQAMRPALHVSRQFSGARVHVLRHRQCPCASFCLWRKLRRMSLNSSASDAFTSTPRMPSQWEIWEGAVGHFSQFDQQRNGWTDRFCHWEALFREWLWVLWVFSETYPITLPTRRCWKMDLLTVEAETMALRAQHSASKWNNTISPFLEYLSRRQLNTLARSPEDPRLLEGTACVRFIMQHGIKSISCTQMRHFFPKAVGRKELKCRLSLGEPPWFCTAVPLYPFSSWEGCATEGDRCVSPVLQHPKVDA